VDLVSGSARDPLVLREAEGRDRQGRVTESTLSGRNGGFVRTASRVTLQTGFMGDGGLSTTCTILRTLPIR
jgi:hypothetical protein